MNWAAGSYQTLDILLTRYQHNQQSPSNKRPGLEAATPADLIAQLGPLLPALQQHLALAAATVREPPEGGAELLIAGERARLPVDWWLFQLAGFVACVF